MNSNTEEKTTHENDKRPNGRRQRSKLRRYGSFFWSAFMLTAFILIGLQLGGLAHYAYIVTTPPAAIEGKADGIVVLTGGENRLRAAMVLLEQGHAERLLITGVNPTTSTDSLKKSLTTKSELFQCCVDIDHSAKDTIGNAIAAQEWADKIEAKSLFVVTGAFHMPRALKEFSHALGDVRLVAAPVNVPTGKNWWRDHSRVRDMLREYGKLMFVTARDQLNSWTGASWPENMPKRNLAAIENDDSDKKQ